MKCLEEAAEAGDQKGIEVCGIAQELGEGCVEWEFNQLETGRPPPHRLGS